MSMRREHSSRPVGPAGGRTGRRAGGLFLALFVVSAATGRPDGARAEGARALDARPPGRVEPSVEPTVDELCRAAVALALAEPERARGFITRARAAGWLPELRFRMFRRFARTDGLTLDDTATTTPVDVSGVDDVRYEWRATWDLSRMVFNPDELQAHAEALRMADVRRDIQSLVIRLYFERRRLLTPVRRAAAPSGGAGAAGKADDQTGEAALPEPRDERRRLRVEELEAELEALSGIPFPPSGGPMPGRAGTVQEGSNLE